MIALITTALGIISILLEMRVQNSPQRRKEQVNDESQATRQDIAAAFAGDHDAVDRLNDTLDQLQSGPDSPQGQHNPGDLLGAVHDLTGASILPGTGGFGEAGGSGEKK